jgi:hypothetical protein
MLVHRLLLVASILLPLLVESADFAAQLFSVEPFKAKPAQMARIAKTSQALQAADSDSPLKPLFDAIVKFVEGDDGFERFHRLLNFFGQRTSLDCVENFGDLTAYLGNLRLLPPKNLADNAEHIKVVESMADRGDLLETYSHLFQGKLGSDGLVVSMFREEIVQKVVRGIQELYPLAKIQSLLYVLECLAETSKLGKDGSSVLTKLCPLVDRLVPLKAITSFKLNKDTDQQLLQKLVDEYDKAMGMYRPSFFARPWFIYSASIGTVFVLCLSLLLFIMIRRPSIDTKKKSQ